MLWLYVVILLVVAFGLWAAYRLLGTPSRLAQADYAVVLADVASSAERAARRLRDAFEMEGKWSRQRTSPRHGGWLLAPTKVRHGFGSVDIAGAANRSGLWGYYARCPERGLGWPPFRAAIPLSISRPWEYPV